MPVSRAAVDDRHQGMSSARPAASRNSAGSLDVEPAGRGTSTRMAVTVTEVGADPLGASEDLKQRLPLPGPVGDESSPAVQRVRPGADYSLDDRLRAIAFLRDVAEQHAARRPALTAIAHTRRAPRFPLLQAGPLGPFSSRPVLRIAGGPSQSGIAASWQSAMYKH